MGELIFAFRGWALVALSSGLLSLSATSSLGDEAIQAAQQALAREEFFFGKVTGTMDVETRAALRRFQIHEGLPVTGELDEATARALQPASPAAPVVERTRSSVREQSGAVEQEDQAFLEQIEEPEMTSEVAEERAVAPAPVAPPPPPPRSAEREVPPAGISPTTARKFVSDYLRAAEAETPEQEVSLYGERVDYFTSGRVNRGFIKKDQRNYYRRWPERRFDLESEPEVVSTSGNTATVRFRLRYSLRRGDDMAKGVTENIMRLKQGPDGLRIVGIRERKLKG